MLPHTSHKIKFIFDHTTEFIISLTTFTACSLFTCNLKKYITKDVLNIKNDYAHKVYKLRFICRLSNESFSNYEKAKRYIHGIKNTLTVALCLDTTLVTQN